MRLVFESGLYSRATSIQAFTVFRNYFLSRKIFEKCRVNKVFVGSAPVPPLDIPLNIFADKMAAIKPSPYTLVDIGANLNNGAFKLHEMDDIVQRSKEAGLQKIIVTGTSIENSRQALQLARNYEKFLHCSAGIHPHDAKHFNSESEFELEKLAQNEECVCIGECGLDFNRNFSPRDDQLRAFDVQVELACKLEKPLFVHEREAHKELLEILTKPSRCKPLPPTVIHCFTGSWPEAKAYLDAGFYIGLTGFLWKDRLTDGVQYMLKNGLLPLNRLLLETDAPFMYPNVMAKKGKNRLPDQIKEKLTPIGDHYLRTYCSFERNEPCSLVTTCELIAAFMDKDPQVVASATTENAKKFFAF